MQQNNCTTRKKHLDAGCAISDDHRMEKLKAYLDEAKRAGTSAAEFAELIGKSPSAVSRYASGKQVPKLETMAMIEKITHKAVPITAWLRN